MILVFVAGNVTTNLREDGGFGERNEHYYYYYYVDDAGYL